MIAKALSTLCVTVALMCAPAYGAASFQIVEEGSTTTTSAVVAAGGPLSLDVLAVSIASEDGVETNLDSFTYRIVYSSAGFTLEGDTMGAPFDSATAPGGFNGSIPWTGLPLEISNTADGGSPLSTPLVADLYRTTAAENGGPASGTNVVLETLTLRAPATPGKYGIRLLVLEAADRTGAFHSTEGGIGFTVTVEAGQTTFTRGDCNDDGAVDISDAVTTLGALFLGERDPDCHDACDSNDDGGVDISDAIATLGVLFLGQGNIPLPGANDCGIDPTEDEVRCVTFSQCP